MVTKTLAQRYKKRTHHRSLSGGPDKYAGYVFVAPWFFGFLAFTLFPMMMSLYISFTNYDMLSSPVWVGIQNYKDIFLNDELFRESVRVTLVYVLLHVPLRLLFSLAVAVLLFKTGSRIVAFYRAVFYIPSIIGGSVAIAVMWRQIFGSGGAINAILLKLGLIDRTIGWLGNPDTALGTLVILAVWQFGSPMLIFLAGLKQIPESYYEAAAIDGAGAWRKFIMITLPLLTPVIFFNVLMQIIRGFMCFTEAYVVTNGGPFNKTLFYVLYLFQKSFSYYQMGYGCALAWILLIFIGFFTVIIFRTSNYWVYYESEGK
jgi:multiple sugar transport system permease protein